MLPFSLAATILFKYSMFIFALAVLATGFARRERAKDLSRLRTPAVVVLMIAALAASLLYTSAPLGDALNDFAKYGKLLLIPIVPLLVRDRREALLALGCYMAVQTFVVISSYLLTLGLQLPWVREPVAERQALAAVFSSYLDQSIMTVGAAVLCWYLRRDFPGRYGAWVAVALTLLCAVDVLLLLPGRSAQVALLVALALALYGATPVRLRPVAPLAPLLLFAALMAFSPHFNDRVTAVVTESIAYSRGDRTPTSAGERLNFWQRSIEAIQERPLAGFGVGSWNHEYRRLEGSKLSPLFAHLRNPHQEYLMWTVQLGVIGLALLLAFGFALLRDASRFRPDVRHAAYSFVAVLAVVCLFNTTLFDGLIGDYFCLLLGLLLTLGLRTAPEGTSP
jgi:O-antigen ligase